MGSRRDWDEEFRGGRMEGEKLLHLGNDGAVDYGAEQTAGAPRRICLKSGRAIATAPPHAASAAMVLAVAAAAGGEIQFGRSQKGRSQVAPEKDG
jgi:hypothetical protein